MRIAQIAPLWQPIAAQGTSEIEKAIGLLTDELVRRGHQVTLFASIESQTLAHLEAIVPQALCQGATASVAEAEAIQRDRLRHLASQFDLIHCHNWVPPFALTESLGVPTLYTLHRPLTPELVELCRRYRHHNFVSVSDAQRRAAPDLNYIRTIHNGIDLECYPFKAAAEAIESEQSDEFSEPDTAIASSQPYLAFWGRFSPESGVEQAIAIAQQAGLLLKLAGKIDPADRNFFEQAISPRLDGYAVEYLGEVDPVSKITLLSEAVAVLFPITWEQPFGLSVIESMAMGTPVVAMNRGFVSEVIVSGKTGFICNSFDEMAEALLAIDSLNRRNCRELVARHFSTGQMVDKYEAAYSKVLEKQRLTLSYATVSAVPHLKKISLT
ncbi:glycosyltransferase family 4 protein [Sphaerothrix gracilis]|uniref:glycosyltransferase family 4 protein n=1 Tax=Sphaerothrix gracilis TaxID=3151835 RepID=UPI0031FBBC00